MAPCHVASPLAICNMAVWSFKVKQRISPVNLSICLSIYLSVSISIICNWGETSHHLCHHILLIVRSKSQVPLTSNRRGLITQECYLLEVTLGCVHHSMWVCVCARVLNCAWLSVTPRTIACQAPLSIKFSRQKCWIGLPFPTPRDLPDPGIELISPALAVDSSPMCHLGRPHHKKGEC